MSQSRSRRNGSLSKTLERLKSMSATMKRKLSKTSEVESIPLDDPYYDDMAKEIFEQLGREKEENQFSYKALDSIFKHPENGATVYIG